MASILRWGVIGSEVEVVWCSGCRGSLLIARGGGGGRHGHGHGVPEMWRSGLGVVGVASVRRRAGGVDVLDDEDCAPVERLGVAWHLQAEGRLWRPRRVDGRRGDGVAAVCRVAGGGSGWRGAPRTHRGGGARSARARAADTRPQQPLCCAARRLAAARLANGGVSGDAWRQGKRGRAGRLVP